MRIKLLAKPYDSKLGRRIWRALEQRTVKERKRSLKIYVGHEKFAPDRVKALRPLRFKQFPDQVRATGSLKRHERRMRRIAAWRDPAEIPVGARELPGRRW